MSRQRIDVEDVEAAILASDSPSTEDLENLERVLLSDWFLRCLRPLFEEMNGNRKHLVSASLESAEGVNRALRVQGKVQGISRALETLVDQVNEYREKGSSDG